MLSQYSVLTTGNHYDYIDKHKIIHLAFNHMTTVTFDTQELVNELENSGFTRKQSETVISVLKKSQSELATKSDIVPLASKTDLLELKVDLVKWVGALMLAQVAVIAALVKLL